MWDLLGIWVRTAANVDDCCINGEIVPPHVRKDTPHSTESHINMLIKI